MTLSDRTSSISTSNRETIRVIQLGLIAVAVALIMSGTAGAEDYPSGAGALERFDAGSTGGCTASVESLANASAGDFCGKPDLCLEEGRSPLGSGRTYCSDGDRSSRF